MEPAEHSFRQKMEAEGPSATPLPPPPPPPPPPPLLPPPPPGLPLPPPPPPPGLFAKVARRSTRMRNFNWETLPKHSVVGKHNIWTAAAEEEETRSKYELDTDRMEELFSHQQDKALKRQSMRGMSTSTSGGEMVTILNSKRSMNIGIFLKQFKRPAKEMIEDIKSGICLSFASGKVRELCKLVPEEGEIKQLIGFKGDHFALPEADLFMLMLVKIPSYEERLSCLVLREEFFPLMEEMKEFIDTLTAAGQELLESDNLHSVIRLVLKTGNYMNAGGYAGSALGFRMASLLKLADTKSNKPGMNLMHYVVMQAQKADMALLKFSKQLQHIEAASRINKGEIDAEFERQVKKVKKAKADTLKQEDLKAQMEDFLKKAEVCLAEIGADLQELQSVSHSVAEYFCEDPNKFKLEECCSIFHSFCERFMRAMQENKAREVAEAQRRHRDRLQNAAKRRSTATCSSRDKEMTGVALESILNNFLTKRVSRRRSGRPTSLHGRPTSGSPNNGSLSEITSQTNLPTPHQHRAVSFIAQGMGRKEWNSAIELTDNSSQKKEESGIKDNESKVDIPIKDEGGFKGLLHAANRTDSISNPGRSFSTNTDYDEEDLEDNNKEEAQRLREAATKVMRFQQSRGGSTSSGEYSLENQKSPGAKNVLCRQRTIDEDTDRFPDDPTNEELVKFLLEPTPLEKLTLVRRHTLPTKVPKTEEQEDNLFTPCPVRTPGSAAREKGTLHAEGPGHMPSKQAFDFPEVPHSFNNSDALDDCPPSTEKKSKRDIPVTRVPDEGPGEQEGKSMEPVDNNLQTNSENIPHKSPWTKNETAGLFFSFFKMFGDVGKQPKSKDTVHKGADSSV